MADCPNFLKVYSFLGGRSLSLNSTNCCSWNPKVVWCNKQKRIEQIALMNQNLSGTLPREIGYFTQLRFLSLRNNKLRGRIPFAWSAIQFEALDLDHNMLVGRLPDLDLRGEKYDFSSNAFEGPIPKSWPISQFVGGEDGAESCSFASTKVCLLSNATIPNLCSISLCTEPVQAVLSLPAVNQTQTDSNLPPTATGSRAVDIALAVLFVLASLGAGIACVYFFYRRINFRITKSSPAKAISELSFERDGDSFNNDGESTEFPFK